jgi:O-antigen ligase
MRLAERAARDRSAGGVLTLRVTSTATNKEGAHLLLAAAIILGAGIPATALIALAGPQVVLLLAGGLIVVVAAIFAPGVVLAMLLLVPFYKGAAQPYIPVDITVLLAALNVAQVIPVLRNRRRANRSVIGLALWGTLALLVIAGIIYAPDQQLAMSRATTFLAVLFLPILPAALRVSSERLYLRQFLNTILGLGVLTVVLGLLALSSTERLSVLGADTISVSRAALLVPILGLSLVARGTNRGIQFLMAVLIPMAIIVALASGSRGPLIVAFLIAAAGAAIRVARVRHIDWRLIGTIAALAVACGVVVVVAAPALPTSSLERFTLLWDFVQGGISREGTLASDASTGARLDLFGAALTMFADRPVTGYGMGGFEVISPRILGPAEPNTYPHNAILQLAAEFGLVGLALFVALILIALARPLPQRATSSALRVLFVFFLLNAMVSGDIFDDRMMWGLLVLIFSLEAGRQITAVEPASRDPRVGTLAARPIQG